MIEILLYPIVLLALLAAIHSYFGLEILRRGVIFTDLAIAQAAAFGAAISIAYLGGEYRYALTLLMALSCGVLIAIISKRDINLEAFIGILYVFFASAIMITLAHSAEGVEHFKSLLANDILFVMSGEIYESMAIYLAVAAMMGLFYRRLYGIYKEILFFSLLAVTVTSSVSLVGVFVVFTLLIAAPFIVYEFGFKRPLISSFAIAIIYSIVAVLIAYIFDLPTGFTIVFTGSLVSAMTMIIFSKRATS